MTNSKAGRLISISREATMQSEQAIAVSLGLLRAPIYPATLPGCDGADVGGARSPAPPRLPAD